MAHSWKRLDMETLFPLWAENENDESRPKYAYLRQWTMPYVVQVRVCRRFSAMPSFEPMVINCNWMPRNKTSVKFESNYKLFI